LKRFSRSQKLRLANTRKRQRCKHDQEIIPKKILSCQGERASRCWKALRDKRRNLTSAQWERARAESINTRPDLLASARTWAWWIARAFWPNQIFVGLSVNTHSPADVVTWYCKFSAPDRKEN